MTSDTEFPSKPQPLPTYAGLRVLLAEDEPMATKLAQGALKVMGITDIVAVQDGEQALGAFLDDFAKKFA